LPDNPSQERGRVALKRYIALLRGVNVGGKNKVPMAELRFALEELGFSDVSSYINSGNIVFSTDIGDESKLKAMCEMAIIENFGLEIPVAIISAEDLIHAMSKAPDWWNDAEDSKHNAFFTILPTTPEIIIGEIGVGGLNTEYEKVAYHGQVMFWSAKTATYSKARFPRVIGTKSYKGITVRNANTTLKLLELVKSE
jgi:uncharacterized protein (DUF1697 family)